MLLCTVKSSHFQIYVAFRSVLITVLELIFLQVDLITTLTKLSSMGQQINYEAYTYPVRKIELSKLKL
jgi:hypothetical protein